MRESWRTRFGFVLAAAGSAIGLGNIWKFPYVTGENGGGLFVLIYLASVVLVGVPIMLAEILIGRGGRSSPVGAFRNLSTPSSPWQVVGWLGVAVGFVILSYYSVVAGWALHYTMLAVFGQLGGSPTEVAAIFDDVYASPWINLGWHLAFMAMVLAVVLGGVRRGLERTARWLMPAMLVLLMIMAVRSIFLDGFGPALEFVFGAHADDLTRAGVLEAVGHAFFTLSVGMGALLTYGSYLRKDEDIVSSSFAIAGLDTLIALLACMVLFPITFSYGMAPEQGPGLVFKNMPVALAQLPGGAVLAVLFFVLLVFAALTSAMSLLEVAASHFIDRHGWQRRRAVTITAIATAVMGIPSALSGGTEIFGADTEALTGFNWFDTLDYLASNWLLPLGGLGMAVFVAWRVGDPVRHQELVSGSRFGYLYRSWLVLLRYLVPVVVVAVFLHAIGVL
ncbi:MAG: sodium-dependent transporter [Deltaproteobacteria bacterium]|nr:sodium-dependent transporter [Deltaproteobacteria bacterium]